MVISVRGNKDAAFSIGLLIVGVCLDRVRYEMLNWWYRSKLLNGFFTFSARWWYFCLLNSVLVLLVTAPSKIYSRFGRFVHKTCTIRGGTAIYVRDNLITCLFSSRHWQPINRLKISYCNRNLFWLISFSAWRLFFFMK